MGTNGFLRLPVELIKLSRPIGNEHTFAPYSFAEGHHHYFRPSFALDTGVCRDLDATCRYTFAAECNGLLLFLRSADCKGVDHQPFEHSTSHMCGWCLLSDELLCPTDELLCGVHSWANQALTSEAMKDQTNFPYEHLYSGLLEEEVASDGGIILRPKANQPPEVWRATW